jgi:murein DD-endopeptidase MepM/ murein hydrolase activator NlpD
VSRVVWVGVGLGVGVFGLSAWVRQRDAAAPSPGRGPAHGARPDPVTIAASSVPTSEIAALSPDGWIWPVPRFEDGRAPRISDGWGSPRDRSRRRHRGVDVMFRRAHAREWEGRFPPGTPNGSPWHFMPDGTPALAARAGLVRWVKKTPRGFEVVIAHSPSWSTFYAHLERPLVRVGQSVIAGQAIGIIGGSPIDPRGLKHLHFELRWGGTSAGAVDPAPHMARWAVLAAPSSAPGPRIAAAEIDTTDATDATGGRITHVTEKGSRA